MKTKIIVNFFLMFLLLLSCDKKACDDDGTSMLNYSIIGKSYLTGPGVESRSLENLVIDDTETWNILVNEMDMINTIPNEFSDIVIDFEEFTVLAFFDEVRNYGGHTIEIISITENSSNIIVDLNYEGSGTNAIINQPYLIIKIDKTIKPVIFI